MSRRTPDVAAPDYDPNLEVMHLPVPSPVRHHERDVDAYAQPPGAYDVPVKKKRGRPSKTDPRTIARKEKELRSQRYDIYCEALIDTQGNKIMALVAAYGLPESEVRERYTELLADVRAGVGSSSLAEILERNDLDVAARIRLIRRQAYSTNPAASLKAVDMLAELDSEKSDKTSYEQRLMVILNE